MSHFNDLLSLAFSLPPLVVLLLVFASAWLEFVFPPYFGDSIMLLGFFLAGQGVVAPHEVFAVAVAGSILGSGVAFLLGERYGAAALDRLALLRRGWGRRGWGRGVRRRQSSDRLKRMLALHGEKVLVVNRFLPFFRNFMIYGAGAFRLRFLPAMVANAISVVAFVSALMALGLMAAGSFEQLQATFQKIYGASGAAVLLVLAAWLAVVSRRQPSIEPVVD